MSTAPASTIDDLPYAVDEPVPRSRRWFPWVLTAIAIAALAGRIVYVLTLADRDPTGGDPFYYHVQANLLADGKGFSEPFTFSQTGRLIPTAFHPPLFSMVLAVSSLFGGTSYFAHKLVACLAGHGHRRPRGPGGPRAGGEPGRPASRPLLAALYPNLWVVDGILMPESLYGLSIAPSCCVAYRYRRTPRTCAWRSRIGVAIGLATLVRGEAVVLVPVLAVPLALWADGDWSHRLRRLGVMRVAGVALVIAPWTLRNLARLDRPVALSVNGDEVIGIANCHDTYYGQFLGFWSIRCYEPTPPGDEVERGAAYRKRGIEYARDHIGRLPYVLLVRQGRMWDVYRPGEPVVRTDRGSRPAGEPRRPDHVLGHAASSLVGVIALRRRRVPLVPLVAMIALATATAVLAYGAIRFRMPAEIAVVVLAAVGIDACLRACGARDPLPGARSRRHGRWPSPSYSYSFCIPLRGLLRTQGPPMEEGFMLVFPRAGAAGRHPQPRLPPPLRPGQPLGAGRGVQGASATRS